MRISDWSSDVCSSDLLGLPAEGWPKALQAKVLKGKPALTERPGKSLPPIDLEAARSAAEQALGEELCDRNLASQLMYPKVYQDYVEHVKKYGDVSRSEEHTSELQSLMRISYAVFCLTKKTRQLTIDHTTQQQVRHR